jgi:DNA-binding response OmpR family regulator
MHLMPPARAKILVVDDESALTDVVAHSLRKAGYQVVTAADGEEGFDLATRERPDLIVSDYQMPRVDGIQMCTRMRRDPRTREVPVILLTARGHRLTPTELAATGICELMPKPFSAKHLVARVADVLAQRRAARIASTPENPGPETISAVA